MIPEAYIRAWRSKAPWRDWAMVEQDLLICRTIIEIFRHPELSKHLVFRGGTALHKLYFHPARRYSEDVDLVQIEPGPIGPIFDLLKQAVTPYLGNPQRKQGPGVVTLVYRIASELPPVQPLKLKLEINSREHFSVMGIQKEPFAVDSPWFQGQCDVPVFCLDELLATKLRALYQRRKGRDLFDLWLGLTEGKADPGRVVDIFRRYMEHSECRVSAAEFAANLGEKKKHPAFASDLRDLLPDGGAHHDLAGCFEIVERELIARL